MTILPDPQSSWTPFRQVEKHFKSRSIQHTTPVLPVGVLDLSRPARVDDDEVWQSGWWGPEEDEAAVRYRRRKGKERARGERGGNDLASQGVRAVQLADGRTGYVVADGCILIPRYLDAVDQLSLLTSALTEYTRPPNPLSLSTHYDLPPDLFRLYALAPETKVSTLFSGLSAENQAEAKAREQAKGQRRVNDTKAGSVLGYQEILDRAKGWQGDVPGSKLGEKGVGELMKELRWANLGWVYRWTTKSYDFTTGQPIPFPTPLGDMCARVVRDIPWFEVFGQDETVPPRHEWEKWKDDYRPDTGIVNFYQMKDTLMGHVDRAELDPSRPLVSISLGHAAIFLLGSNSRETAPTPIILRSGDVLVMSGRGRQAYHGIPRVMEGTLPAIFRPVQGDDETTRAVKRYIATARVNINARQVFPPGFERPPQVTRPSPMSS